MPPPTTSLVASNLSSKAQATINSFHQPSCNSFDICEVCSNLKQDKPIASSEAPENNTATEGDQPQAPFKQTIQLSDDKQEAKPPRKSLHRTKSKKFSINLDCPPSPCVSLEKARANVDAKKKSMMMKRKSQSQKLRKIPEEVDEEQEEVGKIPAIDESNDDKDSKMKNQSEPESDFSKKYLKMKYEIDLQNYLIDKMNRELQRKKMKCWPERELCKLKQRLDKEVEKLRELVKFASCMQRENRQEKWGPISISTVGEKIAKRSQSCPPAPIRLKPPMTPSGISKVSGFEGLDDIMMEEESEDCESQKELQAKRQKIQELCQQMDEMQCQIEKCQDEKKQTMEASENFRQTSLQDPCNITCEELFDMKPCTDDDVNMKLNATDGLISDLAVKVETIKCHIEKLYQDLRNLKK